MRPPTFAPRFLDLRDRFARSLLCSILMLLVGCEPAPELPGLANKGLLPLSTNNAYVGANVFLSRELESSRYLYEFFRGRGAPMAIELIDAPRRPRHLVLFYPREKEVYAAELARRRESREWIIRGPYQIEREDYRELVESQYSLQGDPLFVVRGEQVRFRSIHEGTPTKVVNPIVPPPSPSPVPTPKQRHSARPHPTAAIIRSPEEVQPEIKDFKNLNSDQRALLIAKGFADRDTNGDLLHTVRRESETMGAIAKWYTGEEKNAEQISSLNAVNPHDPLPQGKVIRIPLKLLKKVKVMPSLQGLNDTH